MKKTTARSVVETALRKALARGWQLEVYCRKDAIRSSASWTGEWTMRVVSENSSVAMVLVTHRETQGLDANPRVFKTSTGLISFLLSLDMDVAVLPLRPGIWTRLPRIGEDPDYVIRHTSGEDEDP